MSANTPINDPSPASDPALSGWAEEDLVPISALQHYVYCPRQCALIHVEQVWSENVFTLRGRRAHERVDDPGHRQRKDGNRLRALSLWSERLGLVGRADMVIFADGGMPYPVEHKVGARRAGHADEVQLCAQAFCLEEMFDRPVPEGALFYGKTRRRRVVAFDAALRRDTEAVIASTRALLHQTRLPEPVADDRCRRCSLLEACMPFARQRLHRMDP